MQLVALESWPLQGSRPEHGYFYNVRRNIVSRVVFDLMIYAKQAILKAMTRRIGIYPGTFDPVHQGHIAFCLEVLKRGEVDEIILVPEHSPRAKPGVSPLSERLRLLSEVTAQFPSLRVARLGSHRFTVKETLPELQVQSNGAALSLLIGSDIIPSLHVWDDLELLLENMSLIIGMRHTDMVLQIEAAIEKIGQTRAISIDYSIIETAHSDVASSRIRTGEMITDFSMFS